MLKIFSDYLLPFHHPALFLFSDSFYQSLYLLPFTLVASGLGPKQAASKAMVQI